MSGFSGFGADTRRFLAELEGNNNRDWFQANKHRYDEFVLEPSLEFIAAMGPLLEEISPHFLAIPKRVGGSLMRVYRDTRFGHDKRPYKTNIGIQFRHEMGKDVHAPGYYLHIETASCFLARACGIQIQMRCRGFGSASPRSRKPGNGYWIRASSTKPTRSVAQH